MNWGDVGKQLITIGAPLLGTAIAGPAGGIVAKMIADEFGSEPSPTHIAKAITMAGPEQVKTFEADRRIELVKLANADTADARKREAEIVKATGSRDWVQAYIAVALTTGFFAMIGSLFVIEIPADNQRILDLLVGALVGSFASLVGYYFGSSTGSKNKENLLKR